jgi:putative Flp pilus-assembly TadE/G-like protein
MTRLRTNSGQATVLTVLFLTVIVAMLAAVLDVGAWFRADRKLQGTVDAAALAGAQELPDNSGLAIANALSYANKNGGGVTGANVTISTTYIPNDTIKVTGTKSAPGVFSGVFGVDSVDVHGGAKARVGTLGAAKYVAPIVVNWKHPKLACTPPPCTGQATELEYEQLKNGVTPSNGAGSFGFINLSGDNSVGSSQLGDWIQDGYQDEMELGTYSTSTGNPFSSSHVKDTLTARIGSEILFPVYKTLTGTGSGAKYEIIGWVGFHLTGLDVSGNKEKLFGWFTRVIWQGLPSTNPNQAAFGAYAVELIE